MKPDMKPLFPDEEFDSLVLVSSPITDKVIKELTTLYDLTDWRCVLIDGIIDREYHNMLTVSIFKALALPYLINIRGERTLTRAISARESLRKLCGFQADNLPRKRTFWHFREKYKDVYSELMLRVLISLVLSGKKPRLDLPFVERIDKGDNLLTRNTIEVTLDYYRASVYVTKLFNPSKDLTDASPDEEKRYIEWENSWKKTFRKSEDFVEYRKNLEQYQSELPRFSRKRPRGFLGEMDIPVEVSTTLFTGEEVHFRIVIPDWLSKSPNRESQQEYSERFTTPSLSKAFDKACNVLVIRGEEGREEILLSERKEKGYGLGAYAAPGGKQKASETLEECAKRELMEETNLRLIKSRPVSLYYTRKDPEDPTRMVMSVGVLAEEWDGELRTKEPNQHVGWQWHKLGELPEPVFEPTHIAIEQFRQKKYPELQWEDVEEKPQEQLSLFDDDFSGLWPFQVK
jgi:8-oxo-dGTP diphosphatase